MKTSRCFGYLLSGLALTLAAASGFAQNALPLRISTNGTGLELSWPAYWSVPSGVQLNATQEIQRSYDLQHWETIGTQLLSSNAVAGDQMSLSLGPLDPLAFYRLGTTVTNVIISPSTMPGAEIYGYAGAFNRELRDIGQISAQEFRDRYPLPPTLPRLTWDPTTAEFWTNFNANTNFQLQANELAVFQTNGFVVSERLGATSFAEVYYRVFSGDLPVYVTADSVLQAWHRSYEGMLEEIEELYLAPTLLQVLTNAANQPLPIWWSLIPHRVPMPTQYDGILRDSLLDADFFLTVAVELMKDPNSNMGLPALGKQDSYQYTRVSNAMAAIDSLTLQEINLFGTNRWVDFSQFKPRGHYENSEVLKRYFRAMMWCGLIDLQIAGDRGTNSLRELGTALILNEALNRSGQFDPWKNIDQIIKCFVGWSDSMDFAELRDLVTAANFGSITNITNYDQLAKLQWDIVTGQKGFQNIRGSVYYKPLGPDELRLPNSFAFLGRRFVPDSWVFSKSVYDSIHWDQPGDLIINGKVDRRIPSALDIAFAALGNDQVVPLLYDRMTNTHGRRFRDGLPYQHNLTATRNVIDRQIPESWNQNIYLAWQSALRALSIPTTDDRYPDSMRTRAWAMRTLNSQLASWTQLRHDTILYAKQSYTTPILCSYPVGFVEPNPEFWRRMRNLALVASNRVNQLPLTGTVWVESRMYPGGFSTADFAERRTNYSAFFARFIGHMRTLEGIAEKELAQQALSTNETSFLKNLMENTWNYSGIRMYTGWYPQLFYRNLFPSGTRDISDVWNPVVVDVHTDTVDEMFGDPGCVLHEGVGNVHLLMVAVNNGNDRMVYAGPVFSHYEFEMPLNTRKTDTEWKTDLKNGQEPVSPEWTQSFLVPGPYQVPSNTE